MALTSLEMVNVGQKVDVVDAEGDWWRAEVRRSEAGLRKREADERCAKCAGAVRVRRDLGWRCPACRERGVISPSGVSSHRATRQRATGGLRSSYLWAKEAEAGERGPSLNNVRRS